MSSFPEHLSPNSQDRGVLAKVIMASFDHWQLNKEAQAVLLGISTINRTALTRLRTGKSVDFDRDCG